ncbi:uncharacterized protein LOC141907133 [Tubulanus polymorphus]|uniref:uncharacterized protein LOC141907133 n=1 Tax=Tubulanus polymorphus TaxID=672921 RepID=UPI003DA3262C
MRHASRMERTIKILIVFGCLFLQGSANDVELGTNVNLICTLTSTQHEVGWLKSTNGGDELWIAKSGSFVSEFSGVTRFTFFGSTLKITGVIAADVGRYFCVAMNDTTTARYLDLVIIAPPSVVQWVDLGQVSWRSDAPITYTFSRGEVLADDSEITIDIQKPVSNDTLNAYGCQVQSYVPVKSVFANIGSDLTHLKTTYNGTVEEVSKCSNVLGCPQAAGVVKTYTMRGSVPITCADHMKRMYCYSDQVDHYLVGRSRQRKGASLRLKVLGCIDENSALATSARKLLAIAGVVVSAIFLTYGRE